ncbi:MAG: (Fe-S)-binding protein [Methylovulum sp.]|uniref:(Fe-S)-binding protein n=1 Tax=Methylovulum sp. TaxID=1916980 RepID=UPI002622A0FA|nr:(Fe-S)-binding protein [Methylovulum sp.]MDD2724225.1 (Fe-S)-binding protein [Methylovulum sp.]MDD5125082.1 (Fe-S)-binding protein [Methylovulum sp.]
MFEFMDMGFDQASEAPVSGPYIPDAGECLRCGMCVSTCPTFRLFQTNEETPRSRIRTISKILVENVAITADERQHLDNCLQCRACETVCPSKMAYGELFDQARLKLEITPSWLGKLALGLIENKRWRMRLLPGLAVYLKSGLQKPLRRTGLLKKLGVAEAEALLGKPALKGLAGHYPAKITKRGQVALFTGCIAEHFDQETLQAAIKLLNSIGYDVTVPPQQGCCGAIHQHNGQAAASLIANNIAVFNALEMDAVLHAATGCGAMLSEYQHEDAEAAGLFRQRLQDINAFLLAHWPDDQRLQALPKKVAVHEPCSQRNVLKNQQTVYNLLAKIPELEVAALANNPLCCGAGGSYMLTHPDNAAQLRDLKRQAITAAQADWVVSSNFGCAVFLDVDADKVSHPLLILARQLPI